MAAELEAQVFPIPIKSTNHNTNGNANCCQHSHEILSHLHCLHHCAFQFSLHICWSRPCRWIQWQKMINPFKTAYLHGFNVYEVLWILFTLEQHMVIIISSLKPLQKKAIPNSHTSNSFTKEYIKLSDLPQLLFHAVHTSCFFQSAPLINEITLSWLWRTFPTSARCSKCLGKEQCLNSTGWLLQEADMLQGQQSAGVGALPAHTLCCVWACDYCASSPQAEHLKIPPRFHTSQ